MTTSLEALKRRLAKPSQPFPGPTHSSVAEHAQAPASNWFPLSPPPGFNIDRLPHNLQATVRTAGVWGPRALEAAWRINLADTIAANTSRPSNVDPAPARETRKIRLGPIKSEDWGTLSAYLGFGDDVEEAHFEYGEFATIEIELDPDLRIVGGRVIPLAELRRR